VRRGRGEEQRRQAEGVRFPTIARSGGLRMEHPGLWSVEENMSRAESSFVVVPIYIALLRGIDFVSDR